MKTSSYPVMTQLLPLALASVVTFAGLDGIQAQEKPVLPSVKPAQYKAMQQVVSRTLLLIDKDLHQLKNELPQLADMKEVKVRKSHTDWISWNYHYRRAATWIAPKTLGGYAKGGSFEFGKNGCYLLLEFRLYDEKSDPRHGTGAISANPGPHFQVKNNGVPFGIRITVDAEKNASGMAFKKRVNALLSKHLQGLHKELGSRLVSWGKLVDQSSFDRQYVQGAALTRDQEKIVIELAKKRGIQQVAKIYTYNIHPSTARGIGVKGVEEIKGRDVSCTVLEVRYRKWWFPNEKPRKTDLQMGDFWAAQPRTEKHKILKVKMKEYRVRSVQGLQVSECEAIMELLLAKKYVLESGVNKASLDQIDWSQPKRFGKRGTSISVSFDHKNKGSGFFDLQLKLDSKKLTITQLVQAVF